MNYLLVLGNLLLDEPLWEGRSIPHWETEKAVYCDWPLAARERDVPPGSLYLENNVEAEAQLRILPVEAME